MEDQPSGGPPPPSSSEFPPLPSHHSSPTPPSPSHPIPTSSLVVSPPLPTHQVVVPPQTPAPNSPSSSLWSELFSRKSTTTKFSPPSFTSDGIPVVKAPPSILLKTSEAWKNHIVCHFFGEPPSTRKIFADLNPIWGKKGAIQVWYFSERYCLIFIPNPSTRQWVLDTGFWSAGTVAFAVSL